VLRLLKREELPYRRLGGTRDGVIVIMERACARNGGDIRLGMQHGCMYPLIYMQSRRCIQTAARATRRSHCVAPVMPQRLNLSCLHLIVGSGQVDVRHDRVIKLRYSRRSGIMNDAYRNKDAIRHYLPDVIFFQH